MKRAVFLDRDGVINRDHGYVCQWENFDFLPGVLDAAARLAAAGWTLVVITNQSGIARGCYTEEAYLTLTHKMRETFAKHGATVAAVYHCPHHPAGKIAALAMQCDCRKPEPGMIFLARDDLGLSLSGSVLLGDRRSDIAAARGAGVGRAFLIRSGHTEVGFEDADGIFDSMADCVDELLR